MPTARANLYTLPSGGDLYAGMGEPAGPIAEFIGSPTVGTAPLSVTFTNQSSGVYSSLAWDFGDGGTSSSANPTHVYAAAGTYTVTLAITWAGGIVTRTRTAYVTASAVVVGSLTLNAPAAGVVGVAATGNVQNTDTVSQSWTLAAAPIAPATSAPTVTPSSGTTAAGASTSFTVTAAEAGSYSISLTNSSGGNVVGSPDMLTTVEPAAPPTDKYQFQQPLIFQRAHEKRTVAQYVNSLGQTITLPSIYDIEWGGYSTTATELVAGGFGSDLEVICRRSRRKWVNSGGDWRGLGGVAQSATPWVLSGPLASGTPAGQITLDVLGAVQHADSQRRSYAFFLIITGGGTLAMKGVLNATGPATSLVVTRAGVPEDNPLWYSQAMAAQPKENEGYCNTHEDWQNVSSARKGILEFERVGNQSVAASAATLTVQHNGVTGGSVTVGVMLVYINHPDITIVTPGLAAAYPLDEGLFDHPDCAGAILVKDGDTVATHANEQFLGDFSRPWIAGTTLYTQHTEANFDPTLFGEPGVDAHLASVPMPDSTQMALKLPHRALTSRGCKIEGNVQKSATWGDSFRVLSSADVEARGFPKLATGLGALEFAAPEMGVVGGQSRSSDPTDGGTLRYPLNKQEPRAYLKRSHSGRAVDLRMRAYILLAEGWGARDEDLIWTWNYGSDVGKWPEQRTDLVPSGWRGTDFTGKFPFGVQHTGSSSAMAMRWYSPPTSRATPQVLLRSNTGYSGSSDGYAHQGRNTFVQGHHKAGFKGPVRNGASLNMQEFYDYQGQWMPVPSVEGGQPALSTWGNGWRESANQNGMGFLYQGRWYCYELRWKMNTLVHPYVLPPEGEDFRSYGHLVDGFVSAEIDGFPAAQSPLFATRSSAFVVDWALQLAAGLPFDTAIGDPSRLRPVSNVPPELYMGATEMIFQHYTGGQAANPRRRSVLMNGVAVTVNNQRIGPMAGVSRANGGLGY